MSKQPLTPQDLARVVALIDPAIHPDGERVAYVARTADAARNRYRSDLHLTDAAGQDDRVPYAFEADGPAWSPDGQTFLFLSQGAENGKKQIYLAAEDGGDPRRLTESPLGVISADWSQDSKFIAFLAIDDPQPTLPESLAQDVFVVDTPLWREDGKGSLLHRRAHLFVIPARGGETIQLTRGHFSVTSYCFSTDGDWLFYTAPPDPNDALSQALRGDIFAVRRDGSQVRRVTDFPGAFTNVRQNPRGGLYALGSDMKYSEASPSQLWRIELESGLYAPVLDDFDISATDSLFCDVRFPSRTPGLELDAAGKYARFLLTHGPALRLAQVEIESQTLEWLTRPDCSVLAWSTSGNGQVRAEVRTTMTEFPELFVTRANGMTTRVTNWNEALVDEHKIFTPQSISFTASDGEEVEAWVILPEGEGPFPTILGVHGGPKRGTYGAAFMFEFHMLAGAGYAIVYCNYRGSDGYGTEFARAIFGRRDNRDHLDLMECMDHALALGLKLDPQRLGINGGGFGGFLSNWAITQTNRFKAAISQRSMSNWASLYGASPMGFYWAPQHLGCTPWENPALYAEVSPLTHAAKVQTPLLLIHCEQDLRCTMEQAEQFFTALQRMGKQVKLARVPGEGHAMTRAGTISHRMENLRLILDWFDEHL